jgi:hypothetical protein
LNESELIDLLQRHALLTSSELLDGDVQITRVDRRNQNFWIKSAGARDLFVKQSSEAGATGSTAHEAVVYELFGRYSILENAGKYLIRCFGHDAAARVVMLEALPHAEDLLGYHARTRRVPRRLAAEIGAGLASLHRAARFVSDSSSMASLVGSVRPWVFELPRPDVSLLAETSPANLKVIRILQKQPRFLGEFARLSSEWRSTSLIHGDLKLENCLIYRSRPERRPRGPKFVDWEFAGIGDPRWDVASALSSYLSLWVCSIPMPRPEMPGFLAEKAAFPLSAIRPALSSLLGGYLRTAGLDPLAVPEWLLTTVRMTGAHLVQSAYEYASSSRELTAPMLTLIQLALNVLERPERAAADLFGMPATPPPPSARAEHASA